MSKTVGLARLWISRPSALAFAAALAAGAPGCGDDEPEGTGGSGTTSATSTTSTTSATSTTSTSSMGGGAAGGASPAGAGGQGGSGAAGGQASAGGAGGGAAFETCGECTAPEGAQAGACKAEYDACQANGGCAKIYACSYQPPGCDSTAEGACCTIDCYAQGDAAAVELFKALDACVYCETCTELCGPNAVEYCAAIANPSCG